MSVLPFVPLVPTIPLNVGLSLLPDRSLALRGPDRLAVIAPMYNEELGAPDSLGALLAQRDPPDRIVVSVNGGRDDTAGAVARTLAAAGYAPRDAAADAGAGAGAPAGAQSTAWRHDDEDAPPIDVIVHARQVGKAESVNAVVASSVAEAERYLVMDGDTLLEPDFTARLREHFVRLRRRPGSVRPGEPRWIVEDYGMQSGAVMSFARRGDPAIKRWISWGRQAEYAFSCVLRQGQTRQLGRGSLLGRSRLYTVIGCGFAARRDLFPVPQDTKTEDHDFTLQCQNVAPERRVTTAGALAARGYTACLDGREVPLDALLGGDEAVEFRRGGNVRFVPGAQMRTEDPPHLNGLVRQLERWNGGGQQNALERLGAPLRANVAFTVWSALAENLFGLLLLLLLPLGVALHLGNPSLGIDTRVLPLAMGIDLALMTTLVALGFYRFRRAGGAPRRRAAPAGVWDALRTALPLTTLRIVSPFTYFAAGRHELADYLQRRRRRRWARLGRFERLEAAAAETDHGAWERPSARAGSLTLRMLPLLLLTIVLAAGSLTRVAPRVRPVNVEAWRLTNVRNPVEIVELAPLAPEDRKFAADDGVVTAEAPGGAPRVVAAIRPRIEVMVAAAARDAAGVETGGEAGVEAGGEPGGGRPGGEGGNGTPPDGDPPAIGPATIEAAAIEPAPPSAGRPDELSPYCPPSAVPDAAGAARPLPLGGPPPDVGASPPPLGLGQLLTLARFAPLAGRIEEAARAYAVPADHLLRVLIAESYLDPLARGPTLDFGLSQVTDDALTLLRGISSDPDSPFANPRLFDDAINVYDPEFSICAGAAKLAWARAQPGVDDEREAYALYINPVRGLTNGELGGVYLELTESMANLVPLADTLLGLLERYRTDPAALPAAERGFARIARDAGDERIGLPEAYRRALALVRLNGVPDSEMYERLLGEYYGLGAGELEAAVP